MKPSWDDAPAWAKYIAKMPDGKWNFFEKMDSPIALKAVFSESRPISIPKDPVNAPPHYTEGGIEAIDYIAAKLGHEGFRAYCLGNVLKYVSRWQHKDGEQDLRKAQVYLGWAINGKPTREG